MLVGKVEAKVGQRRLWPTLALTVPQLLPGEMLVAKL